jgi:Family of unknown function (DUF5681)
MALFQKGQSGNPAGYHKGSRHKATLLAEKMLADDQDEILRAVIDAAKAGDSTAMKLCIDRLVPLRKGRPIAFNLPPVETAVDVAVAIGELSRAADGELTVDEASAAASVIELHRRAIEMTDIERRLQKLEEASTR